MPSNVHNRIATSRMGYPEVKTEAGPRKFYLGLIAHLETDQPITQLRFNEDPADEVILHPGSTRTLGRSSNRPLQTFQACSLGAVDGVVTLEFTEEPLPDRVVWHSASGQGPAGPAGPAGDPAAAAVRVRASVGALPININNNDSTDLICDVADVNVAAGYDTAIGVFTCPVDEAGDYQIHASVSTASTPMVLDVQISTDGGGTWNSKSQSAQSTNGAHVLDLLTLDVGHQLKVRVTNPTGAAAELLGTLAGVARSYLTIAKVA